MGFINSRLKRLEERTLGGRCDSCDLPPNGHGRIVLVDDGFPGKGFPDDPEERCARCGRPLYTVLRVVYDSAEGPDAA